MSLHARLQLPLSSPLTVNIRNNSARLSKYWRSRSVGGSDGAGYDQAAVSGGDFYAAGEEGKTSANYHRKTFIVLIIR